MAELTTREDFSNALSALPPEALSALLKVTDFGVGEATTSDALAKRIATQLWWSWSTPLGYVATKTALDDIVDDVSDKLGLVDLMTDAPDALTKLDRLQFAILESTGPASLDDLSPEVKARLNGPGWLPSLFGASTAGSAYGAGQIGGWVVRLGAGPIGRLLPLIPQLAPYWKAIRGVAAVASIVGTPLAVGAGVLSVNHALGSNYRRVVPLLLGAGALLAARAEE